jgi:hypothetical protein
MYRNITFNCQLVFKVCCNKIPYPELKKVLICEEMFPREINNILILPWKEFLEGLIEIIS